MLSFVRHKTNRGQPFDICHGCYITRGLKYPKEPVTGANKDQVTNTYPQFQQHFWTRACLKWEHIQATLKCGSQFCTNEIFSLR